MLKTLYCNCCAEIAVTIVQADCIREELNRAVDKGCVVGPLDRLDLPSIFCPNCVEEWRIERNVYEI